MNYPRTNYEMTQEDFDKIIESCKPVPMIMLNLGTPRSQQENANEAWRELGIRMGFEWDTVQPSPKGDRFFTAIPSETENAKEERFKKEEKEKKEIKIGVLKAEIERKRHELIELEREI